jgi:hypothetical protein
VPRRFFAAGSGDASRISTLVHELTHAVVMSSTYWQYPFFFTDPDGNQYAEPVYLTQPNAFGLEQDYIRSPKVVQVGGGSPACAGRAAIAAAAGLLGCRAARGQGRPSGRGLCGWRCPEPLAACAQAVREWSGCSSLGGAALEDEGGDGTLGTHWEMLYFPVGLTKGLGWPAGRLAGWLAGWLAG